METRPQGVIPEASRFLVFEKYYQSYSQAVYANIRKLVADPAIAQDLLQDVFVALWENWEKVDAVRVSNWLFVVSYNKSITCLKKRLREQAGISYEINFPEELLKEDTGVDEELYSFKLSLLEEAIEKLPTRKRQVFHLCRIEGRSVDEVAEILGISSVSVKDYLKQATRSIKNYVRQYYPNAEAAGFILLAFFLSA